MIPLYDDTPSHSTPFVTVGLIAISTVVFFYQISLGFQGGQIFVYRYGAIPSVIFGHDSLPRDILAVPASFSLLTSMFLHGGFMHLIGNMWYLWIFGNNIEDAMGHGRFIVFYLVCGFIAAMSHALIDPTSSIPMVGASGGISGILGAYLLLYPRARILTLVPIWIFIRFMYLPAVFLLGFWFFYQFLMGTVSMGGSGGGVAWFAHIGGFISGMVLIGFFKRRSVRFFNPPISRYSRRYSEWS